MLYRPTRRAFVAGSAAALALPARRGLAQAKPIRIGVLTDMTGLYADTLGPGSVLAAQMAAEDAGGSVIGRKIEILSADNQNQADIGSTIARRWYDQEGVSMVVGLDNSAVALAVEQISRERNQICIAIAVGTNDFTGKFCTPTALSWNYDSYALTHAVARSLTGRGLKNWFFITVDYAFGTALQADTTDAVLKGGGKVLGSVRHPLTTADFSSYLLAAQASGADVIALANGGADMTGAVKQASEFGLVQSGKTMVPLLCTISDIHALGQRVAQGITLMTSFTWNRTDETRAWGQRFFARHHAMPSMDHAATYSAVLHYIRGIAAAGSAETGAALGAMRATRVNDMFAPDAGLRADGRLVHDMYLVKVKAPGASTIPWDYEEVLATVPGAEAFRPLAETGCVVQEKT
jgi:branched-chain amino acid transport system substrate-binding protein